MVPSNRKRGYGNGTVPNNGKYGNLEWKGPEQLKIWKFEIEGSRTIEIMEVKNGTVPNNEKMG